MATARKPAPDPLKEELPPEPEQKPTTADEVTFEVRISPYIVGGKTFFRWVILSHRHSAYIGDYSGQGDSGFHSVSEAEHHAREYVRRIRAAIALKLNAPESIIITL